MKKGVFPLLILGQMVASLSHAQATETQPMLSLSANNNTGFMTPRDMFFSTPSGITIKNVSTTNPITLSGVYIQTLYSTNGPIVANYGSAFGALWSNVTLGTSAPTNTTTIGANFVYNMITGDTYI